MRTDLLAVDSLQVKVVEAVDNEGAPQGEAHHRVTLRVDGQLVQTANLSQCSQLRQTADVGFQENKMLHEQTKTKKILTCRIFRVA